MVDWQSEESHLLLNPKWPKTLLDKIERSPRPQLSAHIWLATSGTTKSDELKLIALSKNAFLTSAQAVNNHLNVTDKDVWLNVLPLFHVGGLSILARAFLSRSKVVEYCDKWQPQKFLEVLEKNAITLTSLVPTQVFDLVQHGLTSPKSLRAVLVGGGALSGDLYKKARQLGWPLLATYGMTEVCSQVATAPLESLETVSGSYAMQVLSHVQVGLSAENCAIIQSPALYSGMLKIKNNSSEWHPLNEKQFITQDVVALTGDSIQIIGRKDNTKKVLGELVSLDDLNEQFEGVGVKGQAAFLFVSDDRKENDLVCVIEKKLMPLKSKILNHLKNKIPNYCLPQAIYWISEIPKTELGKMKTGQLREMLNILD